MSYCGFASWRKAGDRAPDFLPVYGVIDWAQNWKTSEQSRRAYCGGRLLYHANHHAHWIEISPAGAPVSASSRFSGHSACAARSTSAVNVSIFRPAYETRIRLWLSHSGRRRVSTGRSQNGFTHVLATLRDHSGGTIDPFMNERSQFVRADRDQRTPQ
jgi:hypothetical protein